MSAESIIQSHTNLPNVWTTEETGRVEWSRAEAAAREHSWKGGVVPIAGRQLFLAPRRASRNPRVKDRTFAPVADLSP